MPGRRRFALALDWAPSANHAGFYLARQHGFYSDAGLAVDLLPPASLGGPTPAQACASGRVQACLCPSESVISLATRPPGAAPLPRLAAVAAVLQTDASAIAVLASSDIQSPAGLDGAIYASYGARFESRIVAELIRADGGAGEFTEVAPPHGACLDAVVHAKADATWVFPWEVALAEARLGAPLRAFPLAGVPYGYSPCVAAPADTVFNAGGEGGEGEGAAPAAPTPSPTTRRDLALFLAASAAGWRAAASDPLAAARALVDGAAADGWCVDGVVATAACAATAPHILDADGAWGRQVESRWSDWLAWMASRGVLTALLPSRAPRARVSASLDDLRRGRAGDPVLAPPAGELFTNELLDDGVGREGKEGEKVGAGEEGGGKGGGVN
jgi:hypothetical protein